jgi:protein-L-isoaspartate(D-aspartate) O-methyltransferase
MPLPIACGQTISQPSVVGLMTQALNVGPARHGAGGRHRVGLSGGDPGAAGAAGLYRRPLAPAGARGGRSFRQLGLVNVTAMVADGSFGLPDQAPFDRIIVTAAAEDPPGPLLEQLKPGGIMVVPVGQSDAVQHLIKVTRTESGFDYEELRQVRFVPLVEGLGNE